MPQFLFVLATFKHPVFTTNIFHLQAVENRPFVYFYRNGCFFVTGLETFQILGVEMSTGGTIESNVRAFEAFFINQ
jgi:hypothetical protein